VYVNLIAVPEFLRVYPDDGSGGPNSEDAISEYGATGSDVWGKTLSGLGGSHEWLVYEGRFESVVTSVPDPKRVGCVTLTRDGQITAILRLCRSVAAALSKGWKRKTKAMSAP